MGYRPQIYYMESQKALMWERWQKGDSFQQIAQLFDRNHTSVQGILVRTGGCLRREWHGTSRPSGVAVPGHQRRQHRLRHADVDAKSPTSSISLATTVRHTLPKGRTSRG